MRTGVIIQARMGSTRLPGKALVDLAGRPLLERLYRRMRLAQLPAGVAIATSDQAGDDPIADLGQELGAVVFRGPEADVVTRLLRACAQLGFDAFVRVTGDNPLTDPRGVDQLIAAFRRTPADLLHTKHRRGYPYGVGAELLTRAVLEDCDRDAPPGPMRESLTGYIATAGSYRVRRLDAPAELRDPTCFLTVDYPEDVELMRRIYRHFDGSDETPLAAVLAYLRAHPELCALNAPCHAPFPD